MPVSDVMGADQPSEDAVGAGPSRHYLAASLLGSDPVETIGVLMNLAKRVWGSDKFSIPKTNRIISIPRAPRQWLLDRARMVNTYAEGALAEISATQYPGVDYEKQARKALAKLQQTEAALIDEAHGGAIVPHGVQPAQDLALQFPADLAWAWWDAAIRFALVHASTFAPGTSDVNEDFSSLAWDGLKDGVSRLPVTLGDSLHAVLKWAAKHARRAARDLLGDWEWLLYVAAGLAALYLISQVQHGRSAKAGW